MPGRFLSSAILPIIFLLASFVTGCSAPSKFKTSPEGEALMDMIDGREFGKALHVVSEKPELATYGGRRGFTPIHAAARSGDLALTSGLLSAGVNINSGDANGMQPLHIAVLNNNLRIMETLLANGADINGKNHSQTTVLQLAVAGGLVEATDFLIENGADVNAISKDDFYGDFATALHIAAGKGHPDIAEILIRAGATVDARDKAGETPLHWAVGSKAALRLVVGNEGGSNFSRYGYGAPETVSLLLTHGSDSNAKDFRDDTALHFAFRGQGLKLNGDGRFASVNLLLKAGANPNIKGWHTNTPLQEAGPQSRAIMLAAGADPNIADKDGKTAMHSDVKFCLLDRISILMEYGANIDQGDKEEKTPLHIAVGPDYVRLPECRIKAAKLLLKLSANVNAMDSQGHTPLYYAEKEEHLKIVALLKQNGGYSR